jgi:hypothetical protein
VAIVDELYEEFTTVQPNIANIMQVASFNDNSAEEKWVNVCSHQEEPLPN